MKPKTSTVLHYAMLPPQRRRAPKGPQVSELTASWPRRPEPSCRVSRDDHALQKPIVVIAASGRLGPSNGRPRTSPSIPARAPDPLSLVSGPSECCSVCRYLLGLVLRGGYLSGNPSHGAPLEGKSRVGERSRRGRGQGKRGGGRASRWTGLILCVPSVRAADVE